MIHSKGLIIQDIIQTSNNTTFSPRGVTIELLKNCSETLPTLVEWIYEEWRPYDASLTRERLIEGYKNRLNDDKIPLTLVALRDGVPVGTVSLKEQSEPELVAYSKGDPWLGSLQVILNERGKGLGDELLNLAKTLARGLGYQNIFLYTSNPANLGWYRKRGAHFVEKRSFHNHPITIMQIPLSK